MHFHYQITLFCLLPVAGISYLVHFFRCRKKQDSKLIPLGTMFRHCHRGAVNATWNCMKINLISGSIGGILTYITAKVLDLHYLIFDEVVAIGFGVPFIVTWIIRLSRGCLKDTKIRDIYN